MRILQIILDVVIFKKITESQNSRAEIQKQNIYSTSHPETTEVQRGDVTSARQSICLPVRAHSLPFLFPCSNLTAL